MLSCHDVFIHGTKNCYYCSSVTRCVFQKSRIVVKLPLVAIYSIVIGCVFHSCSTLHMVVRLVTSISRGTRQGIQTPEIKTQLQYRDHINHVNINHILNNTQITSNILKHVNMHMKKEHRYCIRKRKNKCLTFSIYIYIYIYYYYFLLLLFFFIYICLFTCM